MLQSLIAYSMVFVALLYVVWLFLPHAARSRLAALLMGLVPATRRSRFAQFQARAQSAGCSTCKGCATDARAPAAPQPVLLHRR